MASRRYYLSRRAQDDLDEIASYLAERSPDSARRVLGELRHTFKLLARNPESGTRRDDLHPNVRLFTPSRPASNYAIFFYPRPDGIEISDVIHAARDWIGMFSSGQR
jgi:toxin ParE1/3/4